MFDRIALLSKWNHSIIGTFALDSRPFKYNKSWITSIVCIRVTFVSYRANNFEMIFFSVSTNKIVSTLFVCWWKTFSFAVCLGSPRFLYPQQPTHFEFQIRLVEKLSINLFLMNTLRYLHQNSVQICWSFRWSLVNCNWAMKIASL